MCYIIEEVSANPMPVLSEVDGPHTSYLMPIKNPTLLQGFNQNI